ncbi:DUF3991 and TOPRIM domain-containing protein [Bacteroides sp.]|uniref:DUF3991 and TOPRIM domain-containing protein n=1 Tax=Bacteroides sp. TaxID=29523 RepID=UPI00261D7B71|nr:DUF3991 and TOPRIM domain-containing protein [Bacteroides sp.]MDD3040627.1 DUF3991 and TOPRIM domain-containing protein [Bacteroides sp.]
MDVNRFTEEELAIAKSVDLTEVASSLGFTVKRVGKYHTLKEMDSIRIYEKSHWFRWSRQYEKGSNGGSQIDFLRVFGGMEVKEAVFWLLDFAGYRRISEDERKIELKYQVVTKQNETKEFVLPIPSKDNSYLYTYLRKDRGLSTQIIQYFVDKKLIYESRQYHNVIFRGNDKEGVTRFASMRGVFDKEGKSFKCDVIGNDKNYGFNVTNEKSIELVVFEAAIDLMSYMEIFADFDSNKIALGMLSDAPLITFLKENPQILSIRFCLDNDEPGRTASKELCEKYYGLGYEVEDIPPPAGYKDYNEWLVATKRGLEGVIANSAIKKRL